MYTYICIFFKHFTYVTINNILIVLNREIRGCNSSILNMHPNVYSLLAYPFTHVRIRAQTNIQMFLFRNSSDTKIGNQLFVCCLKECLLDILH